MSSTGDSPVVIFSRLKPSPYNINLDKIWPSITAELKAINPDVRTLIIEIENDNRLSPDNDP